MKNILFTLALLVSLGSFGQENKDGLLVNQTIAGEVQEDLGLLSPYITCWGDSLTAGGGWTTLLGTLSGMNVYNGGCLLYTSPSPRDCLLSRMPSSA